MRGWRRAARVAVLGSLAVVACGRQATERAVIPSPGIPAGGQDAGFEAPPASQAPTSAQVLITGGHGPLRIASDANDLYWGTTERETGPAIRVMPKEGGASATLVSLERQLEGPYRAPKSGGRAECFTVPDGFGWPTASPFSPSDGFLYLLATQPPGIVVAVVPKAGGAWTEVHLEAARQHGGEGRIGRHGRPALVRRALELLRGQRAPDRARPFGMDGPTRFRRLVEKRAVFFSRGGESLRLDP